MMQNRIHDTDADRLLRTKGNRDGNSLQEEEVFGQE